VNPLLLVLVVAAAAEEVEAAAEDVTAPADVAEDEAPEDETPEDDAVADVLFCSALMWLAGLQMTYDPPVAAAWKAEKEPDPLAGALILGKSALHASKRTTNPRHDHTKRAAMIDLLTEDIDGVGIVQSDIELNCYFL
jgi:hypothetical protein